MWTGAALAVSKPGERPARFVPMPVEVRERLAGDDPVPRPSECAARMLGERSCARLSALRSLEGMHMLTEVHHATLDEHVRTQRLQPRTSAALTGPACSGPLALL